MISRKKTHRGTLINITNYGVYQRKKGGKRNTPGNTHANTDDNTLDNTPGNTHATQTSNAEGIGSNEKKKGSGEPEWATRGITDDMIKEGWEL